MSEKFAVIVHAGPQETARAVHGLLYAQELSEAGFPVRLLFDGAGTAWIKAFEQPDSQFGPLYRSVKATGIVAGACEVCAGAFGVKSEVQAAGVPLLGQAGGHPSVAQLAKEGYTPIVI